MMAGYGVRAMKRAEAEGWGRRDFIVSAAALALAGCRTATVSGDAEGFGLAQAETERVTAADFRKYMGSDWWWALRHFKALQRLDAVIETIKAEVSETSVKEGAAVWNVYNMGIIVKTAEACFSVDLMHRRAVELAPLLDFALITHNHGDHYTAAFYEAMNGAGKTVISNFLDNYGCADKALRGYAAGERTFNLADVTIRTMRVDHNEYLELYTTAFEIDAAGYRILHSGDCSNLAQLNPKETPDLWCVHPYCGIEVAEGYAKIRPKLIAIGHINELGHEIGNWRWSWQDGLKAREAVINAGGAAVLRHWGERIH